MVCISSWDFHRKRDEFDSNKKVFMKAVITPHDTCGNTCLTSSIDRSTIKIREKVCG